MGIEQKHRVPTCPLSPLPTALHQGERFPRFHQKDAEDVAAGHGGGWGVVMEGQEERVTSGSLVGVTGGSIM